MADDLAQDKDFLAAPTAMKIRYLSSIDADFKAATPEQQHAYLTDLLGMDPEAAKAHQETVAAIPTSAALAKADYPGAEKVKTLSPYSEKAREAAKISDNYDDYMKQSGIFAGTAAATAGAGTAFQATKGAAGVLARALTTGAASGGGALVSGASPEEAGLTAASAAVGQPVAEGLTALATKVVGPIVRAFLPKPVTDEWRAINDVLGITRKEIRIGPGATDYSEAATVPGRALAKAGLTSEDLAKMTPIERQRAIQPIATRAANELDKAFDAADATGKTFDVGNSATNLIRRIANPTPGVDMQDQAIRAFTHAAEEVGITNQRATTPSEARALRQLLGDKARFGPGGDLSSLGTIRAELYRAVNRDLRETFPELRDPDAFYSDVKTAQGAALRQVQDFMKTAPPPTMIQNIVGTVKSELPRSVIRGAGYGLGALGVGGAAETVAHVLGLDAAAVRGIRGLLGMPTSPTPGQ